MSSLSLKHPRDSSSNLKQDLQAIHIYILKSIGNHDLLLNVTETWCCSQLSHILKVPSGTIMDSWEKLNLMQMSPDPNKSFNMVRAN